MCALKKWCNQSSPNEIFGLAAIWAGVTLTDFYIIEIFSAKMLKVDKMCFYEPTQRIHVDNPKTHGYIII